MFKKIVVCTNLTSKHILNRGCGKLIFIVKTNDNRLWYLKELIESQERVIYQNVYNFEKDIDKIVLPMEGIDQFGYISQTNIRLDKILENNKVDVIYTGKVNSQLKKYSLFYGVKIISFFENIEYLRKEFLIKIDVIKSFLEEKLNTRFSDLKILILGNDYKSYLLSEKLNCSILDKGSLSNKSVKEFSFDNYDAFICFNYSDLPVLSDRLIIDMNELSEVDLSLLLQCKKIYFINQLLSQYLTKSGAKIMYDSMVNR